ncbi:uncharacterized protein J8A68_001135 [[Candida] subhashii]|uniref:Agglutinin-like protein N-terminal domain-containing protein n=1 Tax=[Candida] subhashii TaxID=561895 RepID=A0A8J5USU9_9ASCO|nr:uncharacterized protein J8A68_001135 [[Candida] subhashii]KAG7665447.1 hypothetical protein J8A68_001135 [[Candida] subhashii]
MSNINDILNGLNSEFAGDANTGTDNDANRDTGANDDNVTTQEVTGIFTSFDSLVWENDNYYPFKGPNFPSWLATLSWIIDGSRINAGDTFTLKMPCVFKFTSTENQVELKVGSKVYATCMFSPGDVVVPYSELACHFEDSVLPTTYAWGTIRFPFTFNAGYSGLATDLTCANYFHGGSNTVTFYDGDNSLPIEVDFVAGATTDPDKIVRINRVIPTLNKQQHYLLGGKCSNGYTTATLGFEVQKEGVEIDCASIHAAIVEKLNDWYFPEEVVSAYVETNCSTTSYIATFTNIPSGFRPFAGVFMRADIGIANKILYINRYHCQGDTEETDNSKTVTWSRYTNNSPGGNGQEVDLVTRTYTGSTTQRSTMSYVPGEGTMTVVVEIPVPTLTITSTWDGPHTTSTISAAPGDTGTVIELIPGEAIGDIETTSSEIEESLETEEPTTEVPSLTPIEDESQSSQQEVETIVEDEPTTEARESTVTEEETPIIMTSDEDTSTSPVSTTTPTVEDCETPVSDPSSTIPLSTTINNETWTSVSTEECSSASASNIAIDSSTVLKSSSPGTELSSESTASDTETCIGCVIPTNVIPKLPTTTHITVYLTKATQSENDDSIPSQSSDSNRGQQGTLSDEPSRSSSPSDNMQSNAPSSAITDVYIGSAPPLDVSLVLVLFVELMLAYIV